jgi:hypothetical protein
LPLVFVAKFSISFSAARLEKEVKKVKFLI